MLYSWTPLSIRNLNLFIFSPYISINNYLFFCYTIHVCLLTSDYTYLVSTYYTSNPCLIRNKLSSTPSLSGMIRLRANIEENISYGDQVVLARRLRVPASLALQNNYPSICLTSSALHCIYLPFSILPWRHRQDKAWRSTLLWTKVFRILDE